MKDFHYYLVLWKKKVEPEVYRDNLWEFRAENHLVCEDNKGIFLRCPCCGGEKYLDPGTFLHGDLRGRAFVYIPPYSYEEQRDPLFIFFDPDFQDILIRKWGLPYFHAELFKHGTALWAEELPGWARRALERYFDD